VDKNKRIHKHNGSNLFIGNNQLEVVSMDLGNGEEAEAQDATVSARLDTLGHRSDVRTAAFSSDNTALLTASAESLKVSWYQYRY
jgi:hypothetical protein